MDFVCFFTLLGSYTTMPRQEVRLRHRLSQQRRGEPCVWDHCQQAVQLSKDQRVQDSRFSGLQQHPLGFEEIPEVSCTRVSGLHRFRNEFDCQGGPCPILDKETWSFCAADAGAACSPQQGVQSIKLEEGCRASRRPGGTDIWTWSKATALD